MLEKIFDYSVLDTKNIERIVDDENVNINHIVLTKDTGLPEHYSNSNVYLIVVRGTMSIKLGDQETQRYTKGKILNIPYNVKMNINNFDEKILEFFVLKSPNPRDYKA